MGENYSPMRTRTRNSTQFPCRCRASNPYAKTVIYAGAWPRNVRVSAPGGSTEIMLWSRAGAESPSCSRHVYNRAHIHSPAWVRSLCSLEARCSMRDVDGVDDEDSDGGRLIYIEMLLLDNIVLLTLSQHIYMHCMCSVSNLRPHQTRPFQP